MSRINDIGKYEIILFPLYILIDQILRMCNIYGCSLFEIVFILIHAFFIIKFQGKFITCISGTIVGLTMISNTFITVSNQSIFIYAYRLVGFVYIVYYLLYGYIVLKPTIERRRKEHE